MNDTLRKVWAILTPSDRRKSGLMVGLIVLMAFAETVGVVSIMPFLSVLARPNIIHEVSVMKWLYEYFNFDGEAQFIVALGLASVSIVVGSSLFKTFTLHAINRYTYFLRHGISSRLLATYLEQSYEFYLKHNPSALARNVLSEVDQLHDGLFKPVAQLFAQGAVVTAMVCVVFIYDPWVAIGAAGVVVTLYGLIYAVVRNRLGITGRARQSENGARFKACNEVLGGIKDVKISRAEEAYLQRFRSASRGYSRHQANAETLSQSPLYLVEAVGYSGLIILSLFLIQRSDDIAQVLPALGLYGFAAYRILPSAQIMYRGFAQLKFSSAALDVIYEHLSLPASVLPSCSELLVPRESIRLEGVCFAYPSAADKPVFNDLNLSIPVNTSVGIVGVSGSGKSTLMDLLLGLLHPQRGRLIIDDVPVNAGNVANWQRVIGYVPQHIYLADVSVAENIAFGVPKDQIDMAAVERAARLAHIYDFVMTDLEHGFDTAIGDRGVRLSGGQQQRIGIARALYKNPAVLFMDEATSALDTEAETAITKAVGALCRTKTVVIISHREESLSYCSNRYRLG